VNPDQMKFLIDLSKTNSMTATAHNCFCTQQAVSESMKRLEKELNTTLFIREHKGIVFTEAGKMALSYAIHQVNDYERLLHNLATLSNDHAVSGILQIGMAPIAAAIIIKDLFSELYVHCPAITPILTEYPYETLWSMLTHNQLDFIMFGDPLSDIFEKFRKHHEDEYHFEKLYADELVCIMSPHNKLMEKEFIFMEDLQNLPKTLYATGGDYSASPSVINITNQAELHKHFMRTRDTILTIPYHSYMAIFEPNGFAFRSIVDADPVIQYLVWRKDIPEEKAQLYRVFQEMVLKIVSAPQFN